jgi:hypothetical protein
MHITCLKLLLTFYPKTGGHQYGKTDEVVTVLKTAKKKSPYMNNLENYYI